MFYFFLRLPAAMGKSLGIKKTVGERNQPQNLIWNEQTSAGMSYIASAAGISRNLLQTQYGISGISLGF